MSCDAIDWNAVSAVATFAAVVVALAFGLRDSREAKRERIGRQEHALATVALTLADADGSLNYAIDTIKTALDEGATAKDVAKAWSEAVRTVSVLADTFENSRHIRGDLPPESSFVMANAEGIAAAFSRRFETFRMPNSFAVGDVTYVGMRELLRNVLPAVESIQKDILAVADIGRPVIDRNRKRLNQLREKSHDR